MIEGLLFLAGTVTWYVSGDSLKGIEEHLITVQSSDEQWASFTFYLGFERTVARQWSKKATNGEMYLHSEELFFHLEYFFGINTGLCLYGYHFLTSRVKVGPQWKESFSPEMPKLIWNFEHAWRCRIKTSSREDVGPGPWSYFAIMALVHFGACISSCWFFSL